MKFYFTKQSVRSEPACQQCRPEEMETAKKKLKGWHWKTFLFYFLSSLIFFVVPSEVLPAYKWIWLPIGSVLFGLVVAQWYYRCLFAELNKLIVLRLEKEKTTPSQLS